jgi:hypothetical protein
VVLCWRLLFMLLCSRVRRCTQYDPSNRLTPTSPIIPRHTYISHQTASRLHHPSLPLQPSSSSLPLDVVVRLSCRTLRSTTYRLVGLALVKTSFGAVELFMDLPLNHSNNLIRHTIPHLHHLRNLLCTSTIEQ